MALRKLLIASGVTAMGAGTYVVLQPSPAPFHVKMEPNKMVVAGVDVFPIARAIISSLPDSARKYMITKMGAPVSYMKDRHDCLGTSPYSKRELIPDRLWEVTYDMAQFFINSKDLKILGMDYDDEAFLDKVRAGAKTLGPRFEKCVEEDIRVAKHWAAKEKLTDEELFELKPFSLNSYIVKLNDGSLLMYCPVKIRDEYGFADWVNSLGKVSWLVIGSGAHTLNLPPVVSRYPDATIVGPEQAEAKLRFASALPRERLDYVSTKASDLAAVNAQLEPLGVHLHDVSGDVATSGLVAVVDDRLLECDLLYGHADGVGFLNLHAEEFLAVHPIDWGQRIFRFSLMTPPESPNGFLPAYRFRMMDPNSVGSFLYQPPAPDGSSCLEMAQSLRRLNGLKFNHAHGVHFGSMDGASFRAGIDRNWNWLDGKPLN